MSVIIEAASAHIERAVLFLRYQGYSIVPSDAHPRRFVVGDIEPPYEELPPLPMPGEFDPPISLELSSEDLYGVIIALQVAGFRVFSLIDQPGRYQVHDPYLEGAPMCAPAGAA